MSAGQIIFFQGEMQLLGWGDTNSRGRTVTFQLTDEGDEHPFKHCQTRKGKTPGKRYAVVMVELGDQEQPVEKTPSQMAWLLCRDPAFWHFLNERSFAEITDEDSARSHICEGCGIKSRSELDKNPEAHSAWAILFYNPWTAYQESIAKKAFS